MIDCILGKDIDKLILSLIPVLSVGGTFLIMYADKKMIKTDPLIGLHRVASELTSDVPIDKILRNDKYYLPHNRRMKFLNRLGIVMIILGLIFTIYKIYY